MSDNKARIVTLLKGIESGDPNSVAVVNEARYIQHNPQTHEGSEGLAALFKRLSLTSPRVNVVRIFQDGDFVFGHTEYDFDHANVGFEVFRFEDGLAVEHWDNIQRRKGPNPTGRSMVDGPVAVEEGAATEANRALVKAFVDEVLIGRRFERMHAYFEGDHLIQHNPRLGDGVAALRASLEAPSGADAVIEYHSNHRVLADGNFVLAVNEGTLDGEPCAYYDLYRVEGQRLVEHWDTVEHTPPREQWKNDNGKF